MNGRIKGRKKLTKFQLILSVENFVGHLPIPELTKTTVVVNSNNIDFEYINVVGILFKIKKNPKISLQEK